MRLDLSCSDPNRVAIVLRLMQALIGTLILTACTERVPQETETAGIQITPRSISTLLRSPEFTIHLRVHVNDVLLSDREVIASDDIPVSVPLSRLTDTINQVSVLFYIPEYGSMSEELPLAFSQQILSADMNGDTTTLSGRMYQYADSDNDGIFNVHELAVVPRDLDGDSVDNVFDSDSDGDAVTDGNDNIPYKGSNTDSSVIALQQTLQLSFSGILLDVAVEELVGDANELQDAASRAEPLPLRLPTLWPATPNMAELEGKRWTAYGLKAGTRELCPDWQQSVGTSSIRSSVQGTVLLYFRRDDGTAFLAALNDGDIADLDLHDNDTHDNGRGQFNDGLRMVLAPRNTVGWLELYTDSNYEGRVCSLNVTSDRVTALKPVD